jgi:hypothetical protein
MCFSTRSTLKIIVSFGQLKSVEIVGTQIILHVASHQLPIFHQSSTSHPECPTLFESASKTAQRIGQGDGVSHHQLYQLWELNHSCCTWKEQERTKKNIGKTITGSGSKMNSIISDLNIRKKQKEYNLKLQGNRLGHRARERRIIEFTFSKLVVRHFTRMAPKRHAVSSVQNPINRAAHTAALRHHSSKGFWSW